LAATTPKSWTGLTETLRAHQGAAEGISDQFVDVVLRMAEEFASSGRQFPNRPQHLYQIFNLQLHQMSAK
jgi:hypothetical protein